MSDMARLEAIDVIELIMRKYEEDECICCDIMLGDEEYEALRFARDSLKTDEAYQLEYESTTKNDLSVDCVSRQFMLNLGATCIATRNENGKLIALGAIAELPSVTPQTPKCKDCKWWKDSDGKYRRGCGAESKCPINTTTVYCGEGYCYLYEPKADMRGSEE